MTRLPYEVEELPETQLEIVEITPKAKPKPVYDVPLEKQQLPPLWSPPKTTPN